MLIFFGGMETDFFVRCSFFFFFSSVEPRPALLQGKRRQGRRDAFEVKFCRSLWGWLLRCASGMADHLWTPR
jgi:hypothetical protein